MEDRREQLSALQDGELDAFATRRLLEDLAGHPDWKEDWRTYALIGDSLRQGIGPVSIGSRGAARALERLRLEKHSAAKGSRPWALWAVAASVAVIALSVVRLGGVPSSGVTVAESGLPVAPPASDMDRYVDLHQEMANPGLQRVSWVSPGDFVGR